VHPCRDPTDRPAVDTLLAALQRPPAAG